MQSTDKSDANTLPDPDLNPLLNPLLAANMGRWAEVYFTTQPEKRGDAVAQLLRELESASTGESRRDSSESSEARVEPRPPKREREIDAHQMPQFSPEPEGEICACPACAYENPVGQKFCGMCGEPLPIAEPEAATQATEGEPALSSMWDNNEPSTRESDPLYSAPAAEPRDESVIHRELLRGEENERAWQMSEDDVPSFAVEAESVPYRYRVYIGAVLAIMLGVLVYMAWRGTTAFTGGLQSAPARSIPAAPAAAEPAPQPAHSAEDVLPTSPSPAAPAATAKAVPQASAENVPPASVPQAAATTRRTPRTEEREERIERRGPQRSRGTVPAPADSSVTAAGLSGQEELATAEKYLNGGPGAGREAAPWLWKAVAKGNLTATMTLSDLYLKGDGVPKSCDQARLLLDAAARKGSSAAGTRLRNLPAFGCQ